MRQLYYLVLRALSPGALVAFYVYNKTTRAKRARVLVGRSDGRVLLVVNALGDQRWSLPGGGVKRSEAARDAAARELSEELGVDVDPSEFVPLGDVFLKSYVAPIFYYDAGTADVELKPDRYEIRRYGWWLPEALPQPLQPVVTEALSRLSEATDVAKMR